MIWRMTLFGSTAEAPASKIFSMSLVKDAVAAWSRRGGRGVLLEVAGFEDVLHLVGEAVEVAEEPAEDLVGNEGGGDAAGGERASDGEEEGTSAHRSAHREDSSGAAPLRGVGRPQKTMSCPTMDYNLS